MTKSHASRLAPRKSRFRRGRDETRTDPTEGPFGGTIGHGFLSLALIAPTLFELLIDPLQVRQAINYGLDIVRFIAPVKAGKRVRNCISLIAVEDRGRGRWIVTTQNSFEIEGESKPALTAQNFVLLSVRGGYFHATDS